MKEKNKRRIGRICKIIMFIAAAAFLIIYFRQLKKSDDIPNTANREEMIQELGAISEYLNQLDTAVLHNQESLEGISGYSNNITNQLTELDTALSEIQNTFQDYQNTFQIENGEIETDLAAIMKDLEHIKKEIAISKKTVSSDLKKIRTADKKEHKQIEKKLKELNKSAQKIESRLSSYHENIVSIIEKLKNEESDNHKELLKALENSENVLSQLLSNELSVLKELISQSHYEIKLQIEEDVSMLAGKMESLHVQIADAETELEQLLNHLSENEKEMHKAIQKEIQESFLNLQQSLEQIRTDYNDAHGEIKNLLVRIQETAESNQSDLLVTLEKMEVNMQESSTQNINEILNSIGEMSSDYAVSIDNLKNDISQKIENMDTSVNTKFNQIHSSLSGQYSELTNILNTKDTGLREYLVNAFGSVDKKLESVFTYVSNGKKLLASALLTKGVSCDEDAAFSKIRQAILNIPQKVVIGVEQIPGTISYEYHHHSGTEGTSGGCYTQPVYHGHTGDSINGGGCYSVPVIHNHGDSCYKVTRTVRTVTGKWFTGQGTGHACCQSGYGENWAKYRYKEEVFVNDELISTIEGEGDLGYCCGLCFDKKAAKKGFTNTETSIICGYAEGLNGYGLGCGKTTESIVSYVPGCGFTEGQIVGAHIVYDASKTKAED